MAPDWETPMGHRSEELSGQARQTRTQDTRRSLKQSRKFASLIDASDERELIACMGVGRANLIDVQ